jgi:hypothetical protein
MSGKNLILFFFSLLFLFSSVSIKSQEVDSLYYLNPGSKISKLIFDNKIVMFSDYEHFQPGPYYHLLNILSYWYNTCKAIDTAYHLTLVIEANEDMVNGINEYIKDGNIDNIIGLPGTDFYLESIEYFQNLRNLNLKIDSVNEFRKNKITFKVKGFEEDSPFSLYKLSERERELWFVNRRDSLLAVSMINYIKSNPLEQILIFYGGAHLTDKFVNKKNTANFLTLVNDDEAYGYFLAHYLEEEFGYKNVIIIGAWNKFLLNQYLQNKSLTNLKAPVYMIKATDTGLPDSLLSQGEEYIYSVEQFNLPLIKVSKICSRYVFDNIINQINKIKIYLTDSLASLYVKHKYLSDIFYLTGIKFENDSLLQHWIYKDNFDFPNFLYSDVLGDTLFAYISRIPLKEFSNIMRSYYLRLFANYGISYIPIDTNSINEGYLRKWKKDGFQDLMNKVKFTNSIGIYWFGYPDEKIKAKEYLVKFSGQDYTEPENYLQWYRMKYYGYEY